MSDEADMSDEAAALLKKRVLFVSVTCIMLLLVGGAAVLTTRVLRARELQNATTVHAIQYVMTTRPASGGDGMPVTLPGTLQGIIETTVYARSSGYVDRWTKDIGEAVKQGELLAEITAPEIDQQLHQAQAALAQSTASEALAKTSADRWQSLRAKDAVTEQELDERLSAYQQAKADLNAARANVARLRSLQGFNQVRAPFDGVVTRRNVDVGDLVNAGNGGAGQALYTVAQVDPLRLYVYIPQVYANQVKIGDPVDVAAAERTGDHFQGTIARTAGAIDPVTRTLQVEIRVPNPNGKLLAGAYVQARLPIKGDRAAMVVPTNVLLFRPEGTRVAVVGAGGRVRLTDVKLGTDYGATVEVLSGLRDADHIIVNPADSLADGDVVTVMPSAKESG